MAEKRKLKNYLIKNHLNLEKVLRNLYDLGTVLKNNTINGFDLFQNPLDMLDL